MRAFMSDRASRVRWQNDHIDSYPGYRRDGAVAEAERILAESESNEADELGRATYHVTLNGTPTDGWYHTAGKADEPPMRCLAADLRDILPELDRLALDAATDAAADEQHRTRRGITTAGAIFERNHAELARIGG